MNTLRFYTAAILLMPLAAMLTACQTYRIEGRPVPSAAMKSLEPGIPYREIVAEFGQPLVYVDGERVIAYPWADYYGNIYVFNTWNGNVTWEKPVHQRYYALCMMFDGNARLMAWKYIEQHTRESRQTAIETWAASGNSTLSIQAQ